MSADPIGDIVPSGGAEKALNPGRRGVRRGRPGVGVRRGWAGRRAANDGWKEAEREQAEQQTGESKR